MRTFGDFKDKEPEILRRLGVKEAKPKAQRLPPKVTEEPETKVERRGNRVIYRIKVPGVKSEEDIDVQRLRESVEVRAYAQDKASSRCSRYQSVRESPQPGLKGTSL